MYLQLQLSNVLVSMGTPGTGLPVSGKSHGFSKTSGQMTSARAWKNCHGPTLHSSPDHGGVSRSAGSVECGKVSHIIHTCVFSPKNSRQVDGRPYTPLEESSRHHIWANSGSCGAGGP